MESERPQICGPTALDYPGSVGIDLATISGITLVVYTCSSIAHEGIGHGLTCVLLGGKVAVVASTVCVPAGPPLVQSAARIVAAGGTIANLVAAATCWYLLRVTAIQPPRWRYFLWLSLAVNGFIGAGYLAVPTVIGFGDWMNVLRGTNFYWAWRIGIVVAGVILYVTLAAIAAKELQPFIAGDRAERRRRALRLTLIPYFVGGVAFCVAGLFNPVGMKLIIISAAAASFGGTAGLAWLAPWAVGMRQTATTLENPVELNRSWGWIISGLVCGVVLVFVLGPGVKFTAVQDV